ncbi:hypothetical protein [Desulfobacula sp.]|uniref:hypothetical protein n=1 Tax=Desulfobacula sp. TaxID=2593537 RepID=UPI00260F170C|nr:hypothetical protein [Desulfobacula sp.]
MNLPGGGDRNSPSTPHNIHRHLHTLTAYDTFPIQFITFKKNIAKVMRRLGTRGADWDPYILGLQCNTTQHTAFINETKRNYKQPNITERWKISQNKPLGN